jgi:hypothetical protein
MRQRFVPGADQRTSVPGAADIAATCFCAANTRPGIEQTSANAADRKHQQDITDKLRNVVPTINPISGLAIALIISRFINRS